MCSVMKGAADDGCMVTAFALENLFMESVCGASVSVYEASC